MLPLAVVARRATRPVMPRGAWRGSIWSWSGLFGDDVAGLRSFRALLDVERDPLTFGQSSEPRALNGAEVNEHIISAIILGDKAKTL